MKRKLSLLMVLMMVLSLVPAIPSFAATGDISVVNVANDLIVDDYTGGVDATDKDQAPRLVFDNARAVVGREDTRPITSVTQFNIVIEDASNAKFIESSYNVARAADDKGIQVRAISPFVLEVTVEPKLLDTSGDQGQYQNFMVPMFIQATGYGDVKVKFDQRLKAFKDWNKKLLIAQIHKVGSKAVVDKVGNIARNNDIVETTTSHGRIRIIENSNTSWLAAASSNDPSLKFIEIRLDNSDFTFDRKFKGHMSLNYVGDAVSYLKTKDGVDERTLVIDLSKLVAKDEQGRYKFGYLEGSRNELVLDLPIRVARGAKIGTDVTVSLSGAVTPSALTIAKYTDYTIELKAEKVLDVIAGQDVQNKYVAKVTLEEMVPGSLLDGRVIEVELTGEKKDGDKVEVVRDVAAYQYDGYVKLEKLRGTGDLNIVQSDLSSSTGLSKSARVDKNHDGIALFDVEVNRGSNLPDNTKDNKPFNTADKWEFTLPFVVATDYTGDLKLSVKGAGIPEQFVKIATVKAPVTVEVAKTDGGKLADLVIGKQHQEAPDVTIKETEAGALQVGDIIRDYNNLYGFIGTGSNRTDLTNWGGRIVYGAFKVTEGDAKIDSTTRNLNKDNKDVGNLFNLKDKSTKASTFKTTGVKVTLDRTVPYGPYKISVDAGNVKARHGLTDMIQSVDYFNVVTPYPEDKNVKTVFTIGEKKYIQTISGVAKEFVMDVEAQISNNRTVLPMRYVAESIGAKVVYNKETRVATFTKDATVISLNIDSDQMYVNGSVVKLETKPLNVNGRVLISLTNIAQAFGMTNGNTEDGMDNDIEWDAAAKTVTLFATKK